MKDVNHAINLEGRIISEWNHKFKLAMVHKHPYTKRWKTYQEAYSGDYFLHEQVPEYKSNLVSNYIYSIIETIRPIMLDNDPKFQSLPRQPEGLEFSDDLQEAFSYEWDREAINTKLYRELVNVLVVGNALFHIGWDREHKKVKATPISAFNIFPDPLATCMDDAEFLIYPKYVNENVLKRKYPDKADRITGSSINYPELVQDNSFNASITNQVLVLEIYARDWDFEENTVANLKARNEKYNTGRVFVIAPELGVLLEDKANPYQDGDFPFVHIKDNDIPGKFWGEGEVQQMLSPQVHMNQLSNAVIDNAKATANMPWIVDKNAGIPKGSINARPGLIIRKNPGTEVKRDQPPQMPMYVIDAIEKYKGDMEMISGIHNTLRGENSTGVYTAQGIIALQEAGQVRIRLKVKLLEEALGKMGMMWFSRMRQFWKEDKWIRLTRHDGTYDLKKFLKDSLKYDYDIKVLAGSTMASNRGAMLDLMVRLAQTPMPDGQMLVDREAVAEYLPTEVKATMLRRMGDKQMVVETQIKELTTAVQEIGQQLQQLAKESASNDEETFGLIEQLTGAVESVKDEILQLEEEHGKIEKDRKEQEKIDGVKHEAYNQGYKDAESELTPDIETNEKDEAMMNMGEEMMSADESGDGLTENNENLPDDILNGIDEMSDEELEVLMLRYPQIADMIK